MERLKGNLVKIRDSRLIQLKRTYLSDLRGLASGLSLRVEDCERLEDPSRVSNQATTPPYNGICDKWCWFTSQLKKLRVCQTVKSVRGIVDPLDYLGTHKRQKGGTVMSKCHRNYGFCFLVLALPFCMAVNPAVGAEIPKAITVGTSSVGSTFYTMAVGMADILTRSTGINVNAEAVGGSDANARAIRDGKVEMAVLNSFAARNALMGKGTFVKGGPAPLRLVFQGHTSLRQLLARRQAGIQSFPDLKGKVLVGKRRALQELYLITKALLKAYGMTEKDLKIVQTSATSGAIQALEVGSVDAAIFPGGIFDPNVTELLQRKVAVYVPIDDAKFDEALKELGPAFGKFTIPTTMYPNMTQPINAFRLRALLVAGADTPDEVVYRVGKSLIGHQEDIKRVHKAGVQWSLENTVSGVPLPFHPGMVRALKETGNWSPTLQARQEALLAEVPSK
jgi:TRAP transporter TAXI family solute receptor